MTQFWNESIEQIAEAARFFVEAVAAAISQETLDVPTASELKDNLRIIAVTAKKDGVSCDTVASLIQDAARQKGLEFPLGMYLVLVGLITGEDRDPLPEDLQDDPDDDQVPVGKAVLRFGDRKSQEEAAIKIVTEEESGEDDDD